MSDPRDDLDHLVSQSQAVDGRWDALRMCSLCFAVIPRPYVAKHYQWHQRVAEAQS